MSRWLPTGAVGLMVLVSPCVLAKDYALVRDGVSASRIVLAAKAGPVEWHAAAELAKYLEKVSGAEVEIRSEPSDRLYNVFIGAADSQGVPLSSAMEAALSEIAPQGFMLAADRRGLRIVGRQPIGALYGVYDILKKRADVRWFAPGAGFEHCPRKSTIAVPEQVTVSNPSFRFRYLGFVCCNWNSKTVDTWDWMVRNGMTVRAGKRLYSLYRDELEKRGAETYHGGHSFAYLLSDDHFDAHPEYFGLEDGRRTKQRAEGERAARRQPCTSHPEVAVVMSQALEDYLDSPPRGGSYLIGNNDATRWCECRSCMATDPPVEREKRLVGTRYYRFVNRIADQTHRPHPGADLWAWAYQNYQLPPTGVAPDERLSISVCVHHRCYRHAMADETCLPNARFRKILHGWTKFGNPVVTREYNACFGGDPPYLPAEHVYCRDIKYYHQMGLSGFILIFPPPDGRFGKIWNTRGTTEAWYATWQMAFLAAQLAWDVDADYDELVEDMGSKYYGPAWPVMKRYREQLIEMYEETPGHICYGTPDYILGKSLDRPAVEASLLSLLTAAERAAADDRVALRRVRRDREYFGMCWQTLHREFVAKRRSELRVKPRTGPILVDGAFDETDWQKADFVTGFVATDGETVADPQTFVKMLYDSENVYFAVEAMEPSPREMRVHVDRRDGPVWSDSSVEFFISAPSMGGKYVQIVVNPRGAIYDAMNSSTLQADTALDSGAEAATAVRADRWVAEVRLPAAKLGREVRGGEAWKINVGRNYRRVDGRKQSSSWSHGVFHGPAAYRSVVFGDAALLKNGSLEDAVAPNKYQKRTGWVFAGNRVPVHWSFHSGHPGTAALVSGGAASGKLFLRINDGWIHQKINQPADYRNRLVVRCQARGRGALRITVYRYTRARDKHVSTVRLTEAKLDSTEWQAIDAAYTCSDDKILRLAFHLVGEIDIDDIVVTQEPRVDVAPVP